jgi:ribosomal protein S18 acetylase RimI-like enzyme
MKISLVQPDQHGSLVELLCELFEFYNAPVTADPVGVRAHLEANLVAGDAPIGLVVAAADGTVVGLAAIEIQHSLVEPDPARARQLFLKELYVRRGSRSAGVGRALMVWVARYAVDQGCCRIDWTVHRDNERGIAFYEELGAHRVEVRQNYRLEGEALVDLSSSAPIAVSAEPCRVVHLDWDRRHESFDAIVRAESDEGVIVTQLFDLSSEAGFKWIRGDEILELNDLDADDPKVRLADLRGTRVDRLDSGLAAIAPLVAHLADRGSLVFVQTRGTGSDEGLVGAISAIGDGVISLADIDPSGHPSGDTVELVINDLISVEWGTDYLGALMELLPCPT